MTPSDERPTVILADDHNGVLARVREILAEAFNVIATACDGQEAVNAALALRPDVLVLDIAMGRLNGIQAAQEIRRLGLPIKLVFLTVQQDADYVLAAHDLGASFVQKARMHVDLSLALREALAGRIFVSPFSILTPSHPR